jgi:NAD(P)H-flavin reductase
MARRGAVLYWGGRQWADLYAVDSVAAWEAQYPGIRLVPVLEAARSGLAGGVCACGGAGGFAGPLAHEVVPAATR